MEHQVAGLRQPKRHHPPEKVSTAGSRRSSICSSPIAAPPAARRRRSGTTARPSAGSSASPAPSPTAAPPPPPAPAGGGRAAIRYYRETLGRFVRFAGAEPDIGAAAHAWATDRYANARSEASACTYVRAVAILLNFAAARGLYAGDVRLACRSRLGPPRAVPLADLRRALRFLDGDAAILVRLPLAPGARLGEAVGIRYAAIDPRPPAATPRGGKGGGARVVPLSRRLARLLGPLARRPPSTPPPRVLGHAGPTMTLHYARLYGRDAIEIARRYSPEDRL